MIIETLASDCYSDNHIDKAVDQFALRLLPILQQSAVKSANGEQTFLEGLHVGSAVAENEFQSISAYYLRVDAYLRASRGEIRIVTGRKGAGKTALFAYLRGEKRRNRLNIVVDLKPEGYKLVKFCEDILSLVQHGSQEHLLTALWDYVLLLEVAHRVLEDDRIKHKNDHRIADLYAQLQRVYSSSPLHSEGDFSERLGYILSELAAKLKALASDGGAIRLSNPDVTDMMYRHSVSELQECLARYVRYKNEIWILIDNLDKGWPSAGLTDTDVMIVRCLIEGVDKLRRQIDRRWEVSCVPIILLRNDVYEHLIEKSSDRGKFRAVSVDWVDRDQLKEMLRMRFIYSGMDEHLGFDEMWARIATRRIGDQDSIDFLLDRCLMRPRPLLELFMSCRGYAVNRHHEMIYEEDFVRGAADYSYNAVEDISLEVRDVAPDIDNALYIFIGKAPTMSKTEIIKCFREGKVKASRHDELFELLLWYGMFGVEVAQDHFKYIYDMNYNFRMLVTLAARAGARFCVNKAFRAALSITDPIAGAQGRFL